jgi:hypothetical protein
VRDHLVELVQEVEDLGRDVRAVVVDVQAHDHDADHRGGATDELPQPEAEVRHGEHDGALDRQLIVQETARGDGELAAGQPEDDAEEEHLCEDAEELRSPAAQLARLRAVGRHHPIGRLGGDGVADDVPHLVLGVRVGVRVRVRVRVLGLGF